MSIFGTIFNLLWSLLVICIGIIGIINTNWVIRTNKKILISFTKKQASSFLRNKPMLWMAII